MKKSGAIKRRLRSSYFTSVISISLLLFLIGLVGILFINARNLSEYVRENIGLSIIFDDDITENEISRVQRVLDVSAYVKELRYITQDEAAAELEEILGEDFISYLGYNPLLPSMEINLNAAWANPDSILIIEKEIAKFPKVNEVFYQKSLVHLVTENIKRIGLILIAFSLLLLLISLSLINNTIRLSVYAKRFIIKTMQLVGATNGFIRKPFLLNSAMHGLWAALFANLLVLGVIYYAQTEVGIVFGLQDLEVLGILFASIILLGVVITSISTYFAVNRFLRLKSDDLYY